MLSLFDAHISFSLATDFCAFLAGKKGKVLFISSSSMVGGISNTVHINTNLYYLFVFVNDCWATKMCSRFML